MAHTGWYCRPLGLLSNNKGDEELIKIQFDCIDGANIGWAAAIIIVQGGLLSAIIV